MFKIGYRTVKTAVGAAAALFLAQSLDLQFYSSAGILVILCVQNTKRKSLRVSLHRLGACLLSILFSFVIFETIGYHALAIGVLLLLFIPTVVMLRMEEGIVTSSVIVMHIYSVKTVTWPLVWNEVCILIIGIGIALLVNLYMPSVERDLQRYQQMVEEHFKVLLHEMALYLRSRQSDWDGNEMIQAHDLLQKAKALAFQKVQNHFTKEDDYYYRYFTMRTRQFEILERVMPLVASLSWTYEQSEMISEFIESVGAAICPESTGLISLRYLHDLREQFRVMPLPTTREEFETRARLLQLLNEMEQYLIIKSEFKGKHTDIQPV